MSDRPPSVGILTQEKVREEAVDELNKLIEQLKRCLGDVLTGKCEFSEAERILEEIDLLQADVRASADIIGRLSPWMPHLQDAPSVESEDRQEFELAIKGLGDIFPGGEKRGLTNKQKFRFPQLEDAIDWLINQGLATADEFDAMTEQQKREAFSAPGINSRKTLEKLRDTIQTSLQSGESLREFRERLDPEIELLKHEEETIYRTNTKRAYVEGKEKSLDQPGVRDRFQWVLYTATDDNRVRDHHWDLDGKIAKRGSTLHKTMLQVLGEWNCRCDIIPINEREMLKRGGESDISELPSEFRQEIDVSTVI